MSSLGLKVGDKHTYEDFGLRWLEPYTLDPPQIKETLVDIPFADGSLDLSEAFTGRPVYTDRTFSFVFEMPDKDYFEYEELKAELAGYMHGKRREIRSDFTPGYYVSARLALTFAKESKANATLTVSGTASPYYLKDTVTVVAGTAAPEPGTPLPLPNEQMVVCPEITCEEAVVIRDGTTSYAIEAGTITIPKFLLPAGGKTVSLIGGGLVSFEYREGRL